MLDLREKNGIDLNTKDEDGCSCFSSALVYAVDGSYASVRRWPNGYQSAVSFAQLPSSGYQPFSYRTSTDLLLNAFNNLKQQLADESKLKLIIAGKPMNQSMEENLSNTTDLSLKS